jgi:hypothetical protein
LFFKVLSVFVDRLDMTNPISSSHSSHAEQTSRPTRTPTPQSKPNSTPQDTVTLKSTGDVDHDGDGK